MTPNLIFVLSNIACKPNTSPTTQLITTRRICRVLAQRIDSIHDESRAMRREAAKLKAFLPFTRQAIADLEQQALERREDERTRARTVLTGFGKLLVFDKEGLAAALGFDRLCDLLSVNPVHRQQAQEDGDTSLCGLAYISRLEDSADRQSEKWGDGGPLYRACQYATMNFIKECPEHLLPDLFAPGELFGPKLPPDLRIVGK